MTIMARPDWRGMGHPPAPRGAGVGGQHNNPARPDWRGMANLPATGGVIVAANHVSHADPFALAHFVFKAGRWPRYLAKESLFRIPVIGYIITAVGQIPVARGTVDARKALDQA